MPEVLVNGIKMNVVRWGEEIKLPRVDEKLKNLFLGSRGGESILLNYRTSLNGWMEVPKGTWQIHNNKLFIWSDGKTLNTIEGWVEVPTKNTHVVRIYSTRCDKHWSECEILMHGNVEVIKFRGETYVQDGSEFKLLKQKTPTKTNEQVLLFGYPEPIVWDWGYYSTVRTLASVALYYHPFHHVYLAFP